MSLKLIDENTGSEQTILINGENGSMVNVDESGNIVISSEDFLSAAKEYTNTTVTNLINSAPEDLNTLGKLATAFEEHKEATDALGETVANKQNKNIIVYRDSETGKASMTASEILARVKAGDNLYYSASLSEGTLHPYLEGSTQVAFFYSNYIDNTRVVGTGISIDAEGNIVTESYQLGHLKDTTIHITAEEREKWNGIPNNLLNGSATGSLRGINTLSESDSYTIGVNAFAIGNGTKASGKNSFASGQDSEATGSYAHAEGYGTFATAAAAHAEGYDTHATARYAHAEGASTTASGNNSHAEGNSTTSSGHYSHAEGNFTTSAGDYSHAEGNYTQTTEDGTYSHTEGSHTQATKTGAHAEGNYTEANGAFAHTEGLYTKAASMYQHVRGKYNVVDDADVYSTIVGNGTSESDRKNIHTLDWNGEAWFSGDIYVGSTSGVNKDEGSKKVATEDYVEALYQKLNSNTLLGFYCVEDVTIVTNGNSKTYPANSNVEVAFIEGDEFEIVPTSNNSIFQLSAFPGALGTFYPWLEGVKQFSNILFDMNAEEMYTKWNQGNQGAYQVQYAQYSNCIFWSDNPYISEVSKRPNYTLYYSAQLPLCYSSIPDNTFKSFYLAFNVNSDPNWGNKAYRDSFANATWATQVFSYYGARTIGIFGHDNTNFNIVLPKDCRGLMYSATAIENAGTFDAANTTNFGAGLGSWREAFGYCSSLRNLYIKNLKASINVSWSPLNYDSISFIISEAANTSAITISVSPYTYNLLSESDFELATSKNITISLVSNNYIEDRRLSSIANKADKTYVDEQIAGLVNSAPETLDTLGELATAFSENKEVVDALDEAITAKANKDEVLVKTAQTLTDDELTQVRSNLKFIGKNVSGQTFTINGEDIVAAESAEIFGDYINNKCTGQWSIVEGSTNIATGRACHVEGAQNQALNDGCHVEGVSCIASGYWSHAEGEMTRVTSYASHAEGSYTKMPDGTTRYGTASGYASHIEGGGCHAEGSCSHSEGLATTTKGNYAHSEGKYTIASSPAQHVEGAGNIEDANSTYIHIAGNGDFGAPSNAYTLDWNGNGWFSGDVYVGSTSGQNKDEGSKKLATEELVSTKANKTSNIVLDEPLVKNLILEAGTSYTLESALEIANLDIWHCECCMTSNGVEYHDFCLGRSYVDEAGNVSTIFLTNFITLTNTTITNTSDYQLTITLSKVLSYTKTNNYLIDQVEGALGVASGKYSHAEGYQTTSIGSSSHAEGKDTISSGNFSHAEGNNTKSSGAYSHSEGYLTTASGTAAHAEGYKTTASNDGSHAEGYNTTASGDGSHSEGCNTTASGTYSHAEGYNTAASNSYTHSEGYGSKALSSYSHAEGYNALAQGLVAHAEGVGTNAASNYQHVQGKHNIADTEGIYAHIVGNGDTVRSNAHTLDWNGNAWFAGDVYVGSTSGTNKDEGSKKLLTEEDVLALLASYSAGSGFCESEEDM